MQKDLSKLSEEREEKTFSKKVNEQLNTLIRLAFKW